MIGKKLQDHILISTDLLDCAGKTASVFRGSASFVAEFGRSAINVMGNHKRNKLYYTSFPINYTVLLSRLQHLWSIKQEK